MKKKRFTEEQIIGILREQEAGAKVADLTRKSWLCRLVLQCTQLAFKFEKIEL